jgi:hypothetical protein
MGWVLICGVTRTVWGSLFYSVCPPELGKLVNLVYL